MSDAKLIHPADNLAKALMRATGLLQTLGDLYNPNDETFSGGNNFVMHAIGTVQTLVSDARTALEDVHFSCDLTLLDHPDLTAEPFVLPETQSMATAMPAQEELPPVEEVAASPQMQEPEYVAPKAAPQTYEQDHFAQSYLELLRKLTAAEVFAAEQQALSLPGTTPDLLPLLRSLREDLQKMTNAA